MTPAQVLRLTVRLKDGIRVAAERQHSSYRHAGYLEGLIDAQAIVQDVLEDYDDAPATRLIPPPPDEPVIYDFEQPGETP